LLFSQTAFSESLEKVVFQTLASNPDLLAELQNRNAVEQQVQQAKSGYYPSVDLMAGIGNENSKNRYTRAITGTDDYVDLTRSEEALVVTQNLFNGYGTSSDVERYSSRLKATNHRLHDESEKTALRVAEVYLAVLRNTELVNISNRNLAVHNTIYNKVKARSRSGVGRKSDLDQVSGRLALARANLIADQANLRNAQTNYMQVVGKLPSDLVRPADKQQALPGDMEQAVKLAVQNNPVLKAAGAEVDAAIAQRDGSRSGYYPKFDLVFEQSRNENVDGVEEVEKDYSVMLKMKYNLFNGGFDKSRSQEAAYRLNESKNDLDSTRRQVIESMKLAWNSYQSILEQIPYLQQHVDASSRTRRAYNRQFSIGQRTLLDLLDSENELYQAKRKMIIASYEKQISGYRVLTTMGKFIDVLEPAQKKL
jgi:adhesin transport system outer membrane protein